MVRVAAVTALATATARAATATARAVRQVAAVTVLAAANGTRGVWCAVWQVSAVGQ